MITIPQNYRLEVAWTGQIMLFQTRTKRTRRKIQKIEYQIGLYNSQAEAIEAMENKIIEDVTNEEGK